MPEDKKYDYCIKMLYQGKSEILYSSYSNILSTTYNTVVISIDGFSYFLLGWCQNFRGVSREQVTEATQSVTKPQ
jgi:hypothetical protein